MTCEEIIAKLRKLNVPDENVDMWMMRTLLGPDRMKWRFLNMNAHWTLGGFRYASPTGSLDACVALLRHAMPGFSYRIAECSVSDDAWVIPDFNDPRYGAKLMDVFPDECKRDPTEWMGTDVDQRPPGRPSIALSLSLMLAFKKYQEVLEAKRLESAVPPTSM